MRKLGSNAKPPATNPDDAPLLFSRRRQKSCQGGKTGRVAASYSKQSKNKIAKMSSYPYPI
jgi:hypothetical protein